MMGFWPSLWASPAPAPPADGAPPGRGERARCWAARDEYFRCLDRIAVVDSIAEADKAGRACGVEGAAFEANCASSWVSESRLPFGGGGGDRDADEPRAYRSYTSRSAAWSSAGRPSSSSGSGTRAPRGSLSPPGRRRPSSAASGDDGVRRGGGTSRKGEGGGVVRLRPRLFEAGALTVQRLRHERRKRERKRKE